MLPQTLARVDALKAELDALRPLKPEHEQRLWQKLRLEWNYNSNHIEGNTLTYGETFLLLIHGQTNGGHSMREFEEMKAHDVAVSMVTAWAQDMDRALTENDVRSLNDILLKEPFWKEAITADHQRTQVQVIPGKYKESGNSVLQPDGTLFHYASPEEVPVQMRELMEWYNTTSDLHPLQKVAILHHRFILIHPFGDGNGRTARLLVNYHLMRHGYMPLVVKSADKSNYLRCLKLADAGDLAPFTEYLAEQEQWALELGVKAAKGEAIDESGDLDKRIQLLSRQFESMDSDLTIQKTFTREQLIWMFEIWIAPLYGALILIIQKFHPFFIKPSHHLFMQEEVGEEPHVSTAQVGAVQFTNDPAASVIASLRQQIFESKAFLHSGGRFVLHAHLGDFKYLGKNGFGCVYFAEIPISYHHYEVHIDQFNGGDNRRKPVKVAEGLLHQPVPPAIIADIADQFGRSLAAHVEYWISRGGMPPSPSGPLPSDD